MYETGGLRRTHVRGHANVLKRQLIHANAFNLGLWMRKLFGIGTPRARQGRVLALQSVFGLELLQSTFDKPVGPVRTRTSAVCLLRFSCCFATVCVCTQTPIWRSLAGETTSVIGPVVVKRGCRRGERRLMGSSVD